MSELWTLKFSDAMSLSALSVLLKSKMNPVFCVKWFVKVIKSISLTSILCVMSRSEDTHLSSRTLAKSSLITGEKKSYSIESISVDACKPNFDKSLTAWVYSFSFSSHTNQYIQVKVSMSLIMFCLAMSIFSA